MKPLGAPLGGCLPVEGLVRSLVVEVVAPQRQRALHVGGVLEVLEPQALGLHRLDRALGHRVARGAPQWSERLLQAPACRQFGGVVARDMRAMVAAELDAVCHLGRRAEGRH